uniref:B30.2/SPRY domain-containing protein n=1 Tax=Pseudonaja textilis TaxID=8673 RepID=A0A670Z4K9_PSETE
VAVSVKNGCRSPFQCHCNFTKGTAVIDTLFSAHLKRVSVLRPAVSVILNDSTAHPRLLCQRSTVTWADRYQNYPDLPERFDREFCVLGYQGFNTGWHWWEVSVQEATDNAPVWGTACWAIGVAKESVRRKGRFQLSPQEGIWAVGRSVSGEMVAFDTHQQKLSWEKPLQRLRVRVDYETKEMEFLDAETEALLHTFQMGSLLGEMLQPFFYLGQKGVTLQCEQYPLLKSLRNWTRCGLLSPRHARPPYPFAMLSQ